MSNQLLQTIKKNDNLLERLVNNTTGNSDKVFFPFGGDNYDFNLENCKKFITQSRIKELEALVKTITPRTEGKLMDIAIEVGSEAGAGYAIGYKRALDDIIQILKETINQLKR